MTLIYLNVLCISQLRTLHPFSISLNSDHGEISEDEPLDDEENSLGVQGQQLIKNVEEEKNKDMV